MAKSEGHDETIDPRTGRPVTPIGKEKAKPSSGIGQPIRPEAPEAPAPQSTVPAMKGVPHHHNGGDEAKQDSVTADS